MRESCVRSFGRLGTRVRCLVLFSLVTLFSAQYRTVAQVLVVAFVLVELLYTGFLKDSIRPNAASAAYINFYL